MPTTVTALRSIAITDGIHYLQAEQHGVLLPNGPGHAVEVVRRGGGGRLFIVIYQPAAREAGWDPSAETQFRRVVTQTLETTFRGHGEIDVVYTP